MGLSVYSSLFCCSNFCWHLHDVFLVNPDAQFPRGTFMVRGGPCVILPDACQPCVPLCGSLRLSHTSGCSRHQRKEFLGTFFLTTTATWLFEATTSHVPTFIDPASGSDNFRDKSPAPQLYIPRIASVHLCPSTLSAQCMYCFLVMNLPTLSTTSAVLVTTASICEKVADLL